MLKDTLVYISGPMTAKDGYTIEENTVAGLRVYLDLLQRGIPAFSPHLCGAFPSAWTKLSHTEWIDYDCRILDRCTEILMMPRWDTSAGAVREHEYARLIGLPVVFSVEELARAIDARLTPVDEGKA